MKITKTYLRKRWKDPVFIENLPFPLKHSIDTRKEMKIDKISDLDLRGISNNQLWVFPNIADSDNRNFDLSFGSGDITFIHSHLENGSFFEFKFGKGAGIIGGTVSNCSFVKSRFFTYFYEVIFENCDFSESIFKGGWMNEYGFNKCKFINCNFGSAQWEDNHLIMCWFVKCDFTNFTIKGSKINNFRVDSLSKLPKIKDCYIVGRGFVEETFKK